jgi:RNA polymerase sigma-54 factor
MMALHLGQNLNLRMEQKLKLTPQMIQSIEILLLPQMALEERIMHEVESNPVLEVADEGGSAEPAGEPQADPLARPGDERPPPAEIEKFHALSSIVTGHPSAAEARAIRSQASLITAIEVAIDSRK